MKMPTTDEIRSLYLDYFKRKGHTPVASDSLVPQNDPTLLFTGAGMNQFKDNFLGIKKDLKRATSSQKCVRTADLDEVGRTAYHHSFFEMLGNFSFGDYFKEGAIEMAWEFLTQELKMDKSRLRISVHHSDDEAFNIWKDKIKIRPDWIYKLDDKDNFWPSNAPKDGPNGPCGPCSEIYYDQNPTQGEGGDLEQTFTDAKGTHKRFAEIWNLVFTQYDRRDGGKLVPLEQKNIDTGMGLERLACMLQGRESNFETDNFQKINSAVKKSLKLSDSLKDRRIYAISDHVRAITFMLADGVIPSKEGRGYVLRKIIRRAVWHGYEVSKAGVTQPFLIDIVPTIAEVMKKPYPEITEAQRSITAMLKGEEEQFLQTLERGMSRIDDYVSTSKGDSLPGEFTFELYDTYGFPFELTKRIAEERGKKVDEGSFERLMEEQRKRAKESSKMKGDIFAVSDLEKGLSGLPDTKFLGYTGALEGTGKVLFSQITGNKGLILLDQTPFYAESGGQIGDTGILKSGSFEAKVTDTQKKDKYFLHAVEVTKGSVKNGETLNASVDAARRGRIMRNHTATHLLHAALRNVLGPQVRQLGSLVSAEKLRFDYSYGQPLTADQIKQIEDQVNAEIFVNKSVSKEEKALEEAKKDGALAFFGEKYGAQVRVVTVPGYSKEFCGGTHCDSTGQIGFIVITSDSSIASGTRRIEAMTGEGAVDYVRQMKQQLNQAAQLLKTSPADISDRISKLQDSLKKMEKEKSQAPVAKADSDKISSLAKPAGSYSYLMYKEKGLEGQQLRVISDSIRSKTAKTIYLLCAENGDKIQFVLGATPDLGKAGMDVRELGKSVAELLNSSCGGRADMVQGGGPNQDQLQTNWELISHAISKFLQSK